MWRLCFSLCPSPAVPKGAMFKPSLLFPTTHRLRLLFCRGDRKGLCGDVCFALPLSWIMKGTPRDSPCLFCERPVGSMVANPWRECRLPSSLGLQAFTCHQYTPGQPLPVHQSPQPNSPYEWLGCVLPRKPSLASCQILQVPISPIFGASWLPCDLSTLMGVIAVMCLLTG